MRELKFRFYYKSVGKMYTWDEMPPHYQLNILNDNTDTEEYSPWMQYTGLKDKNGKEIYEGDIIKHKLWAIGESVVREVIYEKGQFRTKHERENELGDSLWDCVVFEAEVIGNKFEHPSLLEESQ
jgi:uncharacterized phage protein (TIGR01671 family)